MEQGFYQFFCGTEIWNQSLMLAIPSAWVYELKKKPKRHIKLKFLWDCKKKKKKIIHHDQCDPVGVIPWI
jgi:hypothetical protein